MKHLLLPWFSANELTLKTSSCSKAMVQGAVALKVTKPFLLFGSTLISPAGRVVQALGLTVIVGQLG
jgi:hypothetical protein